MIRILITLALLAPLSLVALVEPPKPAVPATAEPLHPLAFLQGTWRGQMGNDPVEETWSAPSADSIIGMFRWQSAGKTTLWELLSIKHENGQPVLRLRHFDSKFEPWKGECDAVAALPATTIEAARVIFTNQSDVGGIKSCEYDRTQPAVLKITVTFKDANRSALAFSLKKT